MSNLGYTTNAPFTSAPVTAPVWTPPVATGKKYASKKSPVQAPSVAETYEPTSKPSPAVYKSTAPTVAQVSAPTKYTKKYNKKSNQLTSPTPETIAPQFPSIAPVTATTTITPVAATTTITPVTTTPDDSLYKNFTCGSLSEDAVSAEFSYVYNIDETAVSVIMDSIRTVEGGLLQSMRDNYVVCEASSTRRQLSDVVGVSALPQDKVSGSCGADCTSITGGMTFYINNANDLTGAKCNLRETMDNAMEELEAENDLVTEIAMIDNDELNCEEMPSVTPVPTPISVPGILEPPSIQSAFLSPNEGRSLSDGAITGICLIVIVSIVMALFLARRYRTRTDEASLGNLENELDDDNSVSVETPGNSGTRDVQAAPLIVTKETAKETTGTQHTPLIVTKETVEEQTDAQGSSLVTMEAIAEENTSAKDAPLITIAPLIVTKETAKETTGTQHAPLIVTKETVEEQTDAQGSSLVTMEAIAEENTSAKDAPLITIKESAEEHIDSSNSNIILETSEEKAKIGEENQNTKRPGSPFPELVDDSENVIAVSMGDENSLLGMSKRSTVARDARVRGSIGVSARPRAPPSRVKMSMIPKRAKNSGRSTAPPSRVNTSIKGGESKNSSHLTESMQQKGSMSQDDQERDSLLQVE